MNILNTKKKIISNNTNRLFFNTDKFFTPVLRSRRGVSEVIATVLLLGITVAGAAMAGIYIQDSDISDISSFAPSIGAIGSSTSAIKLINYDTRDTPGEDLARIPGLQNFNPDPLVITSFLCTSTCAGNEDKLPTDGGTEFIVLTVKNIGLTSVTLRGIIINEESFFWDPVVPGTCLDLSKDLSLGGKYPVGGEFAIVREEPPPQSCGPDLWVQLSSNVLLPGAEATLVVKLSSTLGAPNDLALNTPLRIRMDTEKLDLETFLVIVGSIK